MLNQLVYAVQKLNQLWFLIYYVEVDKYVPQSNSTSWLVQMRWCSRLDGYDIGYAIDFSSDIMMMVRFSIKAWYLPRWLVSEVLSDVITHLSPVTIQRERFNQIYFHYDIRYNTPWPVIIWRIIKSQVIKFRSLEINSFISHLILTSQEVFFVI